MVPVSFSAVLPVVLSEVLSEVLPEVLLEVLPMALPLNSLDSTITPVLKICKQTLEL